MAVDQLRKIFPIVLNHAPAFIADVIAIAADEPQQSHVVARLPFPLQLLAVHAVVELTFGDVGGLRNGLRLATGLMAKTVSDFDQAQAKGAIN